MWMCANIDAENNWLEHLQFIVKIIIIMGIQRSK